MSERPKSESFASSARCEQDVARFDVAVDHPLDVCVIERLRHLSADPQPIVQVQVSQAIREARPVHLLHDQEVTPFRLAEVVQPHDPVVNQPGEDLGLEADLLGFLLGAGILQQFDGHVPPEQLVGRPVDGAHAPLAELLFQDESLVEVRAYADHPISPLENRLGRQESHDAICSLRVCLPGDSYTHRFCPTSHLLVNGRLDLWLRGSAAPQMHPTRCRAQRKFGRWRTSCFQDATPANRRRNPLNVVML